MPLPVYISLTVISTRLEKFYRVIDSLINQSLRPDKIILNISQESSGLDNGVYLRDLPEEIRKQLSFGKIEIFKVANIGSYRKLIPTIERYSDRQFLVATADDDVVYPTDWLKGLVQAYQVFHCVVAYRCRIMRFDGEYLLPYESWPFVDMSKSDSDYSITPDIYTVATGRGGILYKSTFFSSLSELKKLRSIAPNQDDMAFKIALMAANIPVYPVHFSKSGSKKQEFDGFHYGNNLYYINNTKKGNLTTNDVALDNIVTYYVNKGATMEPLRRLIRAR
jgi:hypothetical protein